MVFQDPTSSFNPKMKIRDIVCEPLMNFKRIKKSEKDAVCRKLLEMVELPDHPFFIGTQAHPELKSRPNRPHPLFKGFIEASLKNQDK